MAETDQVPLTQETDINRTKRTALVLANLFLYSVAMFTIPFVAFFGVRVILNDYFTLDTFAVNVWSVMAAVVAVNLIICAYAYKAYHEVEYDEDGNVIDQHAYTPLPTEEGDRSSLNLKQD